jgi:hypothetical protein
MQAIFPPGTFPLAYIIVVDLPHTKVELPLNIKVMINIPVEAIVGVIQTGKVIDAKDPEV